MLGVFILKQPKNLRSRAEIQAMIDSIDAIILQLTTTAMESVRKGNIAEYELDTGQTRTKLKYNTVSSITQGIKDYENLRQIYVNMITGAVGPVRLVNERNFKGY